MTSIEANPSSYPRCEFNKPYDFIDLFPLKSTDYLRSEIDWEGEKHLIWLDYDGDLDDSVLEDLIIIAQNASPLDICIVTIKAKTPPESEDDNGLDLRREFVEAFSEFYPTGEKLTENRFPFILQSILLTNLQKGVIEERSELNGKLSIRKLFSFSYADGAPMLSLGIIFLNPDDAETTNLLDVAERNHDFISSDIKEVSTIIVPHLTVKEKIVLDEKIRELKSSSDCRTIVNAIKINLEEEEIKGYMRYYRFIPQYYESYL
jgi:hypothetical protein